MQPQISVIELVVADLSRSLAFYRRLGLDIPPDADAAPHVEVPLPGGLRLAFDTIDTIRSFDSGWEPPAGGHRIALAFGCDDPADVDRVHAEMVAAAYESHLEPWDAFWGQRYAVLRDPDGNPIDLFAALPSPE